MHENLFANNNLEVKLEVRGAGNRICLRENGSISVHWDDDVYGSRYYDDETEFRRDLDIFVRFGALLDGQPDAVVALTA